MYLPRLDAKWIFVGILSIAIVILHQIPWPITLTLHLTTEQLSFSLPEGQDTLPLLESLPVRSLKLIGFTSLPLEVEKLEQESNPVFSNGSKVYLEAVSREASVAFRGEKGLRLMRLITAAGAQVTLYSDRSRKILMELRNSQKSQVELAILGKRVTLTIKGFTVLNDQKEQIAFSSVESNRTLEVTPVVRNLVFEQYGDNPISLAMQSLQTIGLDNDWNITPSIVPIKVTQLEFLREEKKRSVSAIKELWIDPLISQENSLKDVFLEIPKSEVFALRSISLSGRGFECELTGRTKTVMLGKDRPRRNVVPSMLEYITDHVVMKTIKDILAAVW